MFLTWTNLKTKSQKKVSKIYLLTTLSRNLQASYKQEIRFGNLRTLYKALVKITPKTIFQKCLDLFKKNGFNQIKIILPKKNFKIYFSSLMIYLRYFIKKTERGHILKKKID